MKLTVSQGKRLFHCLAADQYAPPFSYLSPLCYKKKVIIQKKRRQSIDQSGGVKVRGGGQRRLLRQLSATNVGTCMSTKGGLCLSGPFTFLLGRVALKQLAPEKCWHVNGREWLPSGSHCKHQRITNMLVYFIKGDKIISIQHLNVL